MQSDELRRSSEEGRGRKRSFSNMSRSSDVDNTLDIRTKLFTKKARLSITSSSSSTSAIDSMAAAATQSLEEKSSPGTNDPGLSICMSSSRSLDKVDSHIDIGCAEMYNDVESGTNAGMGFPVSGSGIVYCCEETTTVAEIGQEAATQSLEEESSPGSGIVYCCEETTAVAENGQEAATQSLEEESSPGSGIVYCCEETTAVVQTGQEAATQSLEEESSPGSGIVYCCEETTAVVQTGQEAATQSLEEESSPGSGILYCCEETTAVAEIGQDAPSPDSNGPGSGTCMNEVDFCEKGQHKGLVSSANTNVGEVEVREVDENS